METAGNLSAADNPVMPELEWDFCPRWATLRFAEPRPVLSSAVVNGGLTRSRRWLNLYVDGNACGGQQAPVETVAAVCRENGWDDDTVAMMTAASMNSLRIRHARIEGVLVLVAVTTGLANARRVGDRAEYRRLGEQVNECGTINMAVVTGLGLLPAVMTEVLMIATEARVAALHRRGVKSPVSGLPATGTGTDAIAVFSGVDGVRADFAGKHTLLGETVGRLTLAAVGDSIDRRGPRFAGLYPEGGTPP